MVTGDLTELLFDCKVHFLPTIKSFPSVGIYLTNKLDETTSNRVVHSNHWLIMYDNLIDWSVFDLALNLDLGIPLC